MTNEIKEMMEITANEQNDIDAKMSDFVVLIESDLKRLFGEAETRFTEHKTRPSIEKYSKDNSFLIVKITEDVIGEIRKKMSTLMSKYSLSIKFLI